MAKSPITIPSMIEADADYADLVARQTSINERIGEIRRELAETQAAISAEQATAGPRLRAPIAELVGDADAAAVDRRKKLSDLRHQESDHEEANSVIQRRIYDRRSFASRAVIAAVRAEIDARVSAVVAATEAALTAQADLESLIRDLEAEGVEADSLRSGVVPFFLTSGQATRYVAEHGGKNG
ncbi:hypothetical protein [Mesorhizobium sp. B2-3-10]|uniref:hypothetical protein n=1 Tax=Mesorhizobium sp. B2-3-10 TaxID=2589954 RepID=UPI00112AFD24|nr:hypothetical protein [Mesorhizobium sp. B2-3-10]TPL97312.1 hypothetical protein FJ943_18200 [Mesorhizobium sp. B2-3-10]